MTDDKAKETPRVVCQSCWRFLDKVTRVYVRLPYNLCDLCLEVQEHERSVEDPCTPAQLFMDGEAGQPPTLEQSRTMALQAIYDTLKDIRETLAALALELNTKLEGSPPKTR